MATDAWSNSIDVGDSSGGRFLSLLRPYTSRMLIVLLLLGLLAITNMALPYAIKLLIDDVFEPAETGDTNWTLLFGILGGLILIYVARNTLFYNSRMFSLRVSEDLCFSLRKRLFEHLQQLSMRFYHSNQPGRIGARVMDDTFKIQSFIQDKLPTFLLNLLMFQVLVVVLCVVNLSLALASMIILPLQFMTYRHFKMSIRRSHSEAQENMASAYANLIEKFLGMEVVKGFSAEGRETATFNRAIDASRRSQIRSQRYHFTQKVIADLLVGFGTVLLFGYGAYEVIRGPMSPGEFIMFFTLVGMLYPAVLELISGAGHLSRATASIDRIYEMLDVPAQDEGVTDYSRDEFGVTEGRVELRHVSFQFENSDPILNDLTLTINPGERVSITGPSGSGKSTMLNLLPRFHKPTSGEILIDRRNVNEAPVRALRAGISLAFQEVFLFNTSILENLRYAKPDATIEEIEEVCAITGADKVVHRLPDGFATKIGEYGGELSRGEKQRITLARALLKDARILILDEATASIDAGSAREIMERLFERMGDRTIIMVTHDVSLLQLVNRTVSIQEGRIAYDGPTERYLRCNVMPPVGSPVRVEPNERAVEPESEDGGGGEDDQTGSGSLSDDSHRPGKRPRRPATRRNAPASSVWDPASSESIDDASSGAPTKHEAADLSPAIKYKVPGKPGKPPESRWDEVAPLSDKPVGRGD